MNKVFDSYILLSVPRSL